jgi:putative sterol carrier protein
MNSSQNLNISQLLERLPEAFIPEAAAGINVTIQLTLSGDQSGSWIMQIKDQTCQMISEGVDKPDLALSADTQDCLDIFSGKLDPMRAYMRGKIRLHGDILLAMKLINIFSASQAAKMLSDAGK